MRVAALVDAHANVPPLDDVFAAHVRGDVRAEAASEYVEGLRGS
jgi:hypothetical protein